MPPYDTKYRSSLVFGGGSKPPPYHISIMYIYVKAIIRHGFAAPFSSPFFFFA